jgi:hypothetical protein
MPEFMRMVPFFQQAPSPMRHNTDDSPAALVHHDMLHAHRLLAGTPVPFECLHLSREGPREFVEGTLRSVLLRNGLYMIEGARKQVQALRNSVQRFVK